MPNEIAAGLAMLLTIYNGALTTPQTTITVGAWGGGRAVQVTDVGYQMTGALDVTVLDPYQGARLDFAKPLDFTPYFKDTKQLYLELWVLPRYAVDERGGAGAYVAPGAGGFETTLLVTRFRQLRTLRLVLSGPQGMVSAEPCDLVPGTLGERGWRRIDVPINKFLPKPKGEFKVDRMIIGGSPAETFYIGQVAVVRDTSAIEARIVPHDTHVTAGETTEMAVQVEGGAAQTRVAWDFDANDGIQEDAVGTAVLFSRNEPGDYTVTYTVSDVDANKQDVAGTLRIRVVP